MTTRRIRVPELIPSDVEAINGALGMAGSIYRLGDFMRDRDPRSRPVFFDHFFGNDIGAHWTKIDTAGGAEAAAGAGEHAASLVLDSTNEAQDAGISFNDVLPFDIDNLSSMQFRASIATPGTGVALVAGLATAHNATLDSVTDNVWFRMDASLACKAESDDGTTDLDDKALTTLVTATYYDFEIDLYDKTDIRFYIDGVRYGSGVKHTLSAFSTGLQPYFRLYKGVATGTCTMKIDWVAIFEKARSTY